MENPKLKSGEKGLAKPDRKQPQHTQGEWNVNYTADSVSDLAIFSNGCQIAIIEQLVSQEETKANAQRIVKAVNMHDELVEALKRLADAHYNGKAQGANWINASEVLKQAEQK